MKLKCEKKRKFTSGGGDGEEGDRQRKEREERRERIWRERHNDEPLIWRLECKTKKHFAFCDTLRPVRHIPFVTALLHTHPQTFFQFRVVYSTPIHKLFFSGGGVRVETKLELRSCFCLVFSHFLCLVICSFPHPVLLLFLCPFLMVLDGLFLVFSLLLLLLLLSSSFLAFSLIVWFVCLLGFVLRLPLPETDDRPRLRTQKHRYTDTPIHRYRR